jgi:3-hydroxyacyl-[acyl-carrier-protein] dehydratase
VRFLLVDRILELESGKRATGIKNVTLSEDFLTHHFPNSPLMPGTLITESLVQLADWVIRESTGFTRVGMAVGFEKVKFHRMVRPGDQLTLEVEVASMKENIAHVKGKVFCEGKLVTAARFSLACEAMEPFESPGEASRIFKMLKR